ncbi:MAG: glutathione S-transferase [Alphaproteobacteria bacterium]|nr:glutathione S-transferase [Alphaproteobacteria bacterium]
MSPQHNPSSETLPLLYSYLNCPYCIRARLAIVAGNIKVRLREVALPNKPQELLTASPKGTVPVLVQNDGNIIDQSLAVVDWAIAQNDPLGLGHHHAPEAEMNALIEENDTKFGKALVRLKYPERFEGDGDTTDWNAVAAAFLDKLEARLTDSRYLAGGHATKVDIAIVPFVHQYASRNTLGADRYAHTLQWLESFRESSLFKLAMQEHPAWISGQQEPVFP